MNDVEWLQQWYSSQCDGDWQHQYGVSIGTLDNPGWTLDVDIIETHLESRPFPRFAQERSTTDWVHCFIKDGKFCGRGGPGNLIELIAVFRRWAESSPDNGAA